jgi:hypothetical protein
LKHDNDPQLKSKRKEYSKQLVYYLSLGYRLIYIDETDINLSIQPNYGFYERNKPLRLRYVGKISRNYTYIAAVDITGVLGYCMFEGV